jgi:Eco57I restriction-modification methylase
MKINRQKALNYLKKFDFESLFIEELGWDNPNNDSLVIKHNDNCYNLTAVAQKRGLTVYHCTSKNGIFPDSKTRKYIASEISSHSFENIIIYADNSSEKQIWQWQNKESDKTSKNRETNFNIKQTGELLLQKLEQIYIDFAEEDHLTLLQVTSKVKKAFDIEKITKKFFEEFQQEHKKFVIFITGIDNEKDKNWYASVILNRLMFLYFLQKKGFLDNGNTDYLQDKLKQNETNFYEFLKILWFEAIAKPEKARKPETIAQVGNIKYLNGGLFLPHKMELKYNQINIANSAFKAIFRLFSSYSWHLDDTPTGKDNEINPDVLGYIFEKYINQKAFGAYYTKPEITNYLCKKTINKYISVLTSPSDSPHLSGEWLANETLTPPSDSPHPSGEGLGVRANHPSGEGLGVRANQLLDEILPNLTILDPACGSGAFLVAALQHLINIYTDVFNWIELHGDEANKTRLTNIKNQHPSLEYYIKKRVITDNLYGVDIMEEATEIAKLRLFLSLVASAEKVEDLEPLPNIDFNIMAGNSLIGLTKIDGNSFETTLTPPSDSPHPSGEGLGVRANKQGSLLPMFAASEYQKILNEKNKSIQLYKQHAFKAETIEGTEQEDRLQMLRQHIEQVNQESISQLNQILLDEFSQNLGIKYEEIQLKGKAKKRLLNLKDMENLKPFHWGYHFDEIIGKKGGFDIILTNPPWEIFKPQAKEFFAEYSDLVTKNKMDIKTFEKQQQKLLENPEIAAAWQEYQSSYPHVSLYYRTAEQYRNQISVVNGKKQGTDINLYKLFVEQCVNLLAKNGECGIVIPSGIYTDLGTKQLREMLFSQTKITGLFCFENRKSIFEGVDSRFKFVVLTFEKSLTPNPSPTGGGEKALTPNPSPTGGGEKAFTPNPSPTGGGEYVTQSFPAKFMRHDVSELANFPDENTLNISVDLIKKLSPDSLSVMEFKSDLDIEIAQKMSQFPLLGAEIEGKWNLKLTNEFHMTNDSKLFKTESGKGRLPLYEGKMIHQFTHNFAQPKYWLDEEEGRQKILGKKGVDNGQILDYQCYRLAFREIAANTNERSFIATLLPKNIFANHKLMISSLEKSQVTNSDLLFICGLLNSFVFDFLIRQRVTTTISMFLFYQLPVPRLTEGDPYFQEIVERAAKLICTSPEYEDLAASLTPPIPLSHGVRGESERAKIRAEIDAMCAKLYGLTETEFSHILSTFPIVSDGVKQAALKAFRNLSKINCEK